MTRIPAFEELPGYFVPLIAVRSPILGVEREFTALVDSGADFTMIPVSMLIGYGVNPRTLVQTGWTIGANGTRIPRFDYSMELWHRGRLFGTRVGVLPNLPRPVVGRGDFMRAFGVHFHWDEHPPAWCVRKIRLSTP